ncbi:MAG: hypothetical protein JWR01_826, partial [Subtercola sp.]|nr:hypothetical protein [Subtercola sp.]
MHNSLEFGAFITPSSSDPQGVVNLSRLVESLGYDLITFQDHPYQPALLDAWTLMTYVAAQTSRIRISPNVLNLPLRLPAVLARSAVSLDLLSGGRFELGLGAGAFWDAIASMGGTKLRQGQAVTALEEAIAIIRGIWNVDDRGGLTAQGEYYSVSGAKRGPRAAHAIPIHVGAYKPRMLALTGRVADGWLVSQPYLTDPVLRDASAIIDDAALAAGRVPSDVRRILNIMPTAGRDPGDWAEELGTLVLEEGIDSFVLASDDPGILQAFAEDVAPAVRQIVEAERPAPVAGTPDLPRRNSAALARRRDGILYDDVPTGLAAVEPGDFGYGDVRSTYMRGGSPGIVLQPADVGQVVDALTFARRHPGAQLALR